MRVPGSEFPRILGREFLDSLALLELVARVGLPFRSLVDGVDVAAQLRDSRGSRPDFLIDGRDFFLFERQFLFCRIESGLELVKRPGDLDGGHEAIFLQEQRFFFLRGFLHGRPAFFERCERGALRRPFGLRLIPLGPQRVKPPAVSFERAELDEERRSPARRREFRFLSGLRDRPRIEGGDRFFELPFSLQVFAGCSSFFEDGGLRFEIRAGIRLRVPERDNVRFEKRAVGIPGKGVEVFPEREDGILGFRDAERRFLRARPREFGHARVSLDREEFREYVLPLVRVELEESREFSLGQKDDAGEFLRRKFDDVEDFPVSVALVRRGAAFPDSVNAFVEARLFLDEDGLPAPHADFFVRERSRYAVSLAARREDELDRGG